MFLVILFRDSHGQNVEIDNHPKNSRYSNPKITTQPEMVVFFFVVCLETVVGTKYSPNGGEQW